MVDFDARDDAVAGEVVGVSLTGGSMVTSGFVEKNNAVNIMVKVVEGKKNVAVVVAVFEIIRDTESAKLLFDRATGFVGGEDAFTF